MAVKSVRRARQVVQNVAGLFNGRLSQSLMPSRQKYAVDDIVSLSTGLRPLDKATGLGGLPRGHITELIAPGVTTDSSGAISIATKIAAKAQRQQQIVTIIDLTGQFDPWLAERTGLMAPHLLLNQPETLFEALTTLETAVREEGFVLIVTGIVSDLLSHIDAARLKMLARRLSAIIHQANSVLLFVTTPLENDPFNPANYPAGFQLSELADIRLWTQAEHWTYKHGLATLYKANLTVIKNDLATVGTGADVRVKFTDA
ncbi:MAG: hypothetical protein R3264_19390 [Anaerolineae bacterium]|nr:hypothetical protein [Anaerolineae bacterium]